MLNIEVTLISGKTLSLSPMEARNLYAQLGSLYAGLQSAPLHPPSIFREPTQVVWPRSWPVTCAPTQGVN